MTKFEIKTEHKRKHRNNDLIKPVLYVSGIKVLSLFTNISLDKTIDICIDNFYNDNENPPNIFRKISKIRITILRLTTNIINN